MMGHTNTKTINQRRPLTTNMKLLLADLYRDRRVPQWKLDGADKNVMRALIDRGYANWHIENRTYTITDAGSAALIGGDRSAACSFDETSSSAKPSAVDRDR